MLSLKPVKTVPVHVDFFWNDNLASKRWLKYQRYQSCVLKFLRSKNCVRCIWPRRALAVRVVVIDQSKYIDSEHEEIGQNHQWEKHLHRQSIKLRLISEESTVKEPSKKDEGLPVVVQIDN